MKIGFVSSKDFTFDSAIVIYTFIAEFKLECKVITILLNWWQN